MVNYYTSQNLICKSIRSILCLMLFIFVTLPLAKAQTTCPDPGGGVNGAYLDYTTARTTNIFPGAVPAGQTGQSKGTVGYIELSSSANVVYPTNTVTINPLLNGVTGSVALRFEILSLVAPDAKIEIFRGPSATGTPVITLTEANRSTYESTSVAYSGPVTLRFSSPTPASGNFDVEIRYMTGDQLITSSFNQKVAVWTAFIQPNSYTFIDDFTLATANTIPISIGYFDASSRFVSAEIGHCLIHDRRQIGVSNTTYPGQITFQVQTDKSNFDRLGSTWNVQQLKMARVAWIIANAPKNTRAEMLAVRDAIWTTMSASYAGSVPGLHNQAKAAVPTVPSSSPAAPTLSMSTSTPTVVTGTPVTFTLNVNGGTAPFNVKLDIPAGVTVNSVSGATLSGNNLSISSSPATVQITATSSTPQSATMKAIFSSITDFYDPANFRYYVPCQIVGREAFQDFLGYSLIEQVFPTANASASWLTPLTCTDGYYQMYEGSSLYRVNIANGTRSLITSIPGANFNAMGYSSIDNFLYGYNRATNQIFKLGADGAEQFTIPNMPAPASSSSRSVGAIDQNGYLYIYEPNATQYVTVDINPNRSTYMQLVDPTNGYVHKTAAPYGTTTAALNISDWAYNPTTGTLQGIINAAGPNAYNVASVNPVTGVWTVSATAVSGGGITNSGISEVFDSQFFDANGNLILYANAGTYFYSVNLTTNTATRLSTAKEQFTVIGNDGASCGLNTVPNAFTCNNLYYQVETDKLYSVNESGTRTLVATLSGSLNAIGYSTVDNLLWGYDNATNQIFKLGANGVIQRFGISNIPATTHPNGYSVGTASTTGYLYLYEKNASEYITIDINPARSETYLKVVDPTASFAIKTAAPWGTTLSGGGKGISDWSFNPTDSQLYALTDGSSATPYQVLQVNPLTGATTLQVGQVTGAGLQSSAQDFGSSIVDANGRLIVFGNTTGHYYGVNIITKTATQLSTVASPSESNDGAFCPLATTPPLPVTLINFYASREANAANLTWATTSETNSKGFEIQRSVDAVNWTQINFVDAKSRGAATTAKLEYHFSDAKPLSGLNYYRLKMIDLDATFAYSQIKAVSFDDQNKLMVLYPNPVVQGRLTIEVANAKTYCAEVTNVAGLVVLKQNLATTSELNVGGLNSGVYVLRITSTSGDVQTKTFIVK